jgi:hypothetical protein
MAQLAYIAWPMVARAAAPRSSLPPGGAGGALSRVVQDARGEALAGTGFAGNHEGGKGDRGEFLEQLPDLAGGATATDEGSEGKLRAPCALLVAQAALGARCARPPRPTSARRSASQGFSRKSKAPSLSARTDSGPP